MAEAYSSKSIINIYRDPIASYSGTYVQTDNRVSLGPKSRITYIKSWGVEDDLIVAENLRLESLVAMSNGEISSRYNNQVSVVIKLRYYENREGTNLVPGAIQTEVHSPYNTSDTDGRVDEYTIKTENRPVYRLEINILNDSPSDISVEKLGLYQSLSITESISDTIGIECRSTGMDLVPLGIDLLFTTGVIELRSLKDGEGRWAGYNVNNKFVWKFTDKTSVG